MRQRWGCDGPAPEGQGYGIPCRDCDGRSRTCATCGGRGMERVDRCPSWHLRQRGVSEIIRAWTWMTQHGHLPVVGGSMDQTRCYLQAAQVLSAATARHREREEQKRG